MLRNSFTGVTDITLDNGSGITGYTYIQREPSGAIAGFLTNTGAHYYPLTDNLGSILYTVDNTGNPISGATYQPFGAQTITAPAPFTQPFGYTGAYTQPATGLIHLSARYYDPTLGRFTQQDPSGQDNNPYTYAGNGPINKTDPSGLHPGSCYYDPSLYCPEPEPNSDGSSWDISPDYKYTDLECATIGIATVSGLYGLAHLVSGAPSMVSVGPCMGPSID